MFSFHYREKGFSLVEILIVGGALSGLALVALNLTKMNSRSSTKFNFDSDTQAIINELSSVLSNPTKCMASLGGSNAVSSTNTINSIDSKYLTTTAGGGKYGNASIDIASYQVVSTDAEVAVNTSYLVINFVNKGILKGDSGLTNITKRIKLFVQVDGSKNITDCRAIANSKEDIWNRGVGTIINYTAGNVGIGTDSPTYLLTVNEEVTSNGGSSAYLTSYATQTINLSSNATHNFYAGGFFSQTKNANSANYININGASNAAFHNGTGSVNNLLGSDNFVYNTSSGVVQNAIGSNGYVVNTGSSNIIDARGGNFYIGAVGLPKVENGYGVRIGTINATNKWSLYAGDVLAPSYFAGNVGIGTTGPTEKLEVNGTIKMTDFQLTSDRRLKKEITPLNSIDELQKILNLRPVQFTWKENGAHDQGLIAQEVKEIFPNLIGGKENIGRGLGVKYISLISSLISSIQEIFHRQNSFEEKIEKRLIEQEARINELERINQKLLIELKRKSSN